MFRRNPHGAGYMYARDGKVTIHKGFMNIEDFLAAVHAEQFTLQDSVVYHFRIRCFRRAPPGFAKSPAGFPTTISGSTRPSRIFVCVHGWAVPAPCRSTGRLSEIWNPSRRVPRTAGARHSNFEPYRD